jgi:hypothetical protein
MRALRRLVVSTLFAATVTLMPATASDASYSRNVTRGNAAHHCTMRLEMGVYLFTAYAKIRGVSGHCDLGTDVTVIGNDWTLGPRCEVWGPWPQERNCSRSGSWVQSALPGKSIGGARVDLCVQGLGPYCAESIIGFPSWATP